MTNPLYLDVYDDDNNLVSSDELTYITVNSTDDLNKVFKQWQKEKGNYVDYEDTKQHLY
tara:strand:- start:1999 stop:2175 length:177 start_codon:yes stop_codon:yes gene_type:complete